MDFRRNGSRDERRRRVLMEDAAGDASGEENASPPKRSRTKAGDPAPSPYAGAAWEEGQPRITALLPLRRLTLWLWLLACSSVAGLLVYLHVASRTWRERFPAVDFSALDLAARGSLGAWFSSLLLAWAGIASVQVYLIRRHRNDDYQGRYRLWPTIAGAFWLGSFVAAARLDRLAGELIATLSGVPMQGMPIGVGLLAAIVAACGLRLIWEIRPSRGALALLAMASGCYLGAAVMTMDWVSIPEPWTSAGAPIACMAGNIFVLLTVAVFGRYVHLQARGELIVRPRKVKAPREKAKKQPEPQEGGAAKKRASKSDLDESAKSGSKEPPAEKKPSPPAASSKPAGKSPPTLSINSDDDEDDESPSPLSKAERRRLRKQSKQKQRAA
jgi:hypothetical protein